MSSRSIRQGVGTQVIGRERRPKVLAAVRSYQREHGRPASQRELCEMVGIPNTGAAIANHLRKLVESGHLRREGAQYIAIGEPFYWDAERCQPPADAPFGVVPMVTYTRNGMLHMEMW